MVQIIFFISFQMIQSDSSSGKTSDWLGVSFKMRVYNSRHIPFVESYFSAYVDKIDFKLPEIIV